MQKKKQFRKRRERKKKVGEQGWSWWMWRQDLLVRLAKALLALKQAMVASVVAAAAVCI